MEEIISRFFHNFFRTGKVGYRIVQVLLCIIGLEVLILLLSWMRTEGADVINNMIASFFGVAAVFILARLVTLFLHLTEDENKVSYRNQDMWHQYGEEYRRIFRMNNSDFLVYCEKLFRKNEVSKFLVEDDPEDFFELDPYIKAHCSTLLEAHAMSKTTDSVTVRLCKFDKPTPENGMTATIYSGRSSYLAHLLTNRALDYFMESDLTIRKLYENDKTLRPLHRAKLSNHFGINALVFLKDNDGKKWLLMPHRKKDATVAKNSVTASVATRLKMENKTYFPQEYANYLQPGYIEKACVKDALPNAIWVKKEWLDNEIEKRNKEIEEKKSSIPFLDIQFLGLSRDIYEGGKPTLFYVVYLDTTPDGYKRGREAWEEEKKNKAEEKQKQTSIYRIALPEHSIDEVDEIYLADWSTVKMEEMHRCLFGDKINPEKSYHDIRLDSAKLTFVDKDKEKHAYAYEPNLISNFWFLEGCPEPAPSAKEAC